MGVMAPGMQSALNENNVRADARQLSLMVKSGMIQSADEHRTYVLDLSATNMSLAPAPASKNLRSFRHARRPDAGQSNPGMAADFRKPALPARSEGGRRVAPHPHRAVGLPARRALPRHPDPLRPRRGAAGNELQPPHRQRREREELLPMNAPVRQRRHGPPGSHRRPRPLRRRGLFARARARTPRPRRASTATGWTRSPSGSKTGWPKSRRPSRPDQARPARRRERNLLPARSRADLPAGRSAEEFQRLLPRHAPGEWDKDREANSSQLIYQPLSPSLFRRRGGAARRLHAHRGHHHAGRLYSPDCFGLRHHDRRLP